MTGAMPRCETCTHWIAPTHPVLWGECRRIGDCEDWSSPYLAETSPAICPMNDNEWCAFIRTLPTFGCVLHEPRL